MSKKTISAIFAALVIATPAVAADWNGLYVGVNAGVGKGSGQFADGCYFCATDNFSKMFGTVGAQAGYNWQIGSAVLGAEADINWASFEHNGILGLDDYSYLRERSKLEWFSTIRARAGMAVDNTLIYVTAGPAFGGINAPGREFSGGVLNPSTVATGKTFSVNNIRTGFSGGVGVEIALENNLSVRGEYLYTDFGVATAYYSGTCGNYVCSVQNTLTSQTLRVGLNYRIQ
jgi:outer membrane immunogenic protein